MQVAPPASGVLCRAPLPIAFSRLPFKPDSLLAPSGYFAEEKVFDQHYGQVLNGLCDYLAETQRDAKGNKKPIIVAIDDLPMSHKFNRKVIDAIRKRGFDVYTYHVPEYGYLPIPLGTLGYTTKYFNEFLMPHKQVAGAVMLTGGSRPLTIAGMRFINTDGGMFTQAQMLEIDRRMNSNSTLSQNNAMGKEHHFNFRRNNYFRYIKQLVNTQLIKKLKTAVFYSSLHGAAKEFFDNLLFLVGVKKHFAYYNASDPILTIDKLDKASHFNIKNIQPILNSMAFNCFITDVQKRIGFINNADAANFRVIDHPDKPIAHDSINALLLHHLVINKKKHGVVVKTHDASAQLDELAQQYGLPVFETPIGFNYVDETIQSMKNDLNENTLIGVDSQGASAIIGNSSIKDGMYGQLLLLELVANTNKSLEDLLNSIKGKLPRKFLKKHYSIDVSEPTKVMNYFNNVSKVYSHMGRFEIDWTRTMNHKYRMKHLYGVSPEKEIKIFFKDDSWLLARQQSNSPYKIDLWLETNINESTCFLSKSHNIEKYFKQFLAIIKEPLESSLGACIKSFRETSD